ncbi:hypothetical protein LX73_0631 [Fodinibius salinus]|uniref:Uncharacterized protein n=1 Tax=Fodinibius salinus TaxID=860790 RepID=A0A5D3YS18_9BACT|nr:hypothetical protein [Fodinibius salinus]TYP95331.1 hypothetical protein LX73_0631 [Fodinibius salinus]
MIRSLLAIVAGYFSITLLNSFAHLIVSVYFKTELVLSGVSQLPSLPWVIGFTILQFVWGLFGGLLASTLAQKNISIAILGFILLIAVIGMLNYSVLNHREPLWHLISSPTLTMGGIFLGYKLQLDQQQKNTLQ